MDEQFTLQNDSTCFMSAVTSCDVIIFSAFSQKVQKITEIDRKSDKNETNESYCFAEKRKIKEFGKKNC